MLLSGKRMWTSTAQPLGGRAAAAGSPLSPGVPYQTLSTHQCFGARLRPHGSVDSGLDAGMPGLRRRLLDGQESFERGRGSRRATGGIQRFGRLDCPLTVGHGGVYGQTQPARVQPACG